MTGRLSASEESRSGARDRFWPDGDRCRSACSTVASVSLPAGQANWWTVALLLGLFAFWAGMVLAGSDYPGGYDWPYTTISSLVYPERNPGGFLWARGGLGLCGACGLYWTVCAASNRTRGAGLQAIGIYTLGFGYLCMMCCASLPAIPRGHEALALAAFVSLCVGAALISFERLHQRASQRRLARTPWLLAGIVAGPAFAPVLFAAFAQTYVARALPTLPWVSPAWRARGIPVHLSFAFWEWVTCAVLSLYLAVLSGAAVPRTRIS